MTGTAMHRLVQFWRHSSARVSPAELRRAAAILGPELSGFFYALPVNDQRHGLDVLNTIEQFELRSPLLLQQAALLHDMGKAGAGLSVVARSLTVSLKALSPRLLHRVLRSWPALGGRYATYSDHARIGAERLRAAGALDLAAVVAEHHATQPGLEVTRVLQRADRLN